MEPFKFNAKGFSATDHKIFFSCMKKTNMYISPTKGLNSLQKNILNENKARYLEIGL